MPTAAAAVRDAAPADVEAVAAIYDSYVRSSVATFDTVPRGHEHLGAKIAQLGQIGPAAGPDLVLVAEADDGVLGVAYSGSFRPRPAYDATREVSVYLREGVGGRGVGRLLYDELLRRLDADPRVHTLVAVVALPNDASERLHRATGFTQVGVLREVGHKLGRWVDTAWYQRPATGPGAP